MDEQEVPESIRQALESVRAYNLSVREAQATVAAYMDDVHRTAGLVESTAASLSQMVTEYAEYARRAIAIGMVQVMAPLVETMQQNADLIRQALALPAELARYSGQTNLAMTAGLAQLSRQQQATGLVVTPSFGPARQRTAQPTGLVVTPGFQAPRQRTAQASLVVTPTITATAEVVPAPKQVVPEDDQGEDAAKRRQLDLAGLAVMLVYVAALGMADAQVLLPQEVKDYLNSLVAFLSLALAIHMGINERRKP